MQQGRYNAASGLQVHRVLGMGFLAAFFVALLVFALAFVFTAHVAQAQ